METETINPNYVTALTVETRASLALNSSKTEYDLRVLAFKHAAITVIKDKAGRDQAHGAAMELMRARTDIERVSKAARDDATKFSKAVIAEEKRLVAIVEPEEVRLKELRDQWDAAENARREAEAAAERARVLAITTRIAEIKAKPALAMQCRTAAAVQRLIDSLESADMTGLDEFEDDAIAARAEALRTMTGLRDAKQAEEEERARINAEQEAEAQRLAAERAEIERQRAELEAAQAAAAALRREAELKQQRDAIAAAALAAEQSAAACQEEKPSPEPEDIPQIAAPAVEAPAIKTPDEAPAEAPAVADASPSDADLIFFAVNAVAAAFDLTREQASARLAAINDWF